MPTYYVMVLGLVPEGEAGGHATCRLIPRAWGVGIWDWAFLATEHKLGVPYQLADSWARGCNLEFAIDAPDPTSAVQYLRTLKLSLLGSGLAPFATPMIATHSINDFSHIKGAAQDKDDPRHERARTIATKAEVVEGWRITAGSGGRSAIGASRRITASQVEAAAIEAEKWRDLVRRQPVLRVLEDTMLSVPQTSDIGQGILQMWTGLESLFPKVQTEVSFRMALYLTQLQQGQVSPRLAYFNRAKKAYGTRSKIAHGGSLREDTEENKKKWSESWSLMVDAYQSILRRGGLPDEEALIAELLEDADHVEFTGFAKERDPLTPRQPEECHRSGRLVR